MANINREEELKIKEWQKRTGGGCVDIRPLHESLEESQRKVDRAFSNLQLFIALNSKK